MAEVKNAFIKSKMNKDLDSRLLPSGEYRDGQNIQVSKSEGEDVGALENAVGNELAIDFNSIAPGTGGVLKTIGLLSDTNSSSLYVFLTTNDSEDYNSLARNFIYSYDSNSNSTTLLVQGAFLNFSKSYPIYGINVLENLLFWTDNRNQPRVVNIDTASKNSSFYNKEDLISVAKYNPYQCIDLYVAENSGSGNTTMKDVASPILPDGNTNPFYDPDWPGDPDYLEDKFVSFSYRFKFSDGEYSIMAPFTQEAFIPKQDGYFLSDDQDNAYRSTIVRFMENKVNSVKLIVPLPYKGSEIERKLNVSEIDILYKESDSLTVKVLDSIKKADFEISSDFHYEYDYQSRKPYKTLPESEIIRVYDKVPVKALGQEIIGNRVVYSNFQDKHTPPSFIDYDVAVTPKFNFSTDPNDRQIEWTTSIVEYPEHTVKQNRNYQVGFVLSDRFGRQSTTILSPVNSQTKTDTDGNVYGGSTYFHPYEVKPAAGENPTNTKPGDSLKVLINNPIPATSDKFGWPGLYNGDVNSPDYNPLGWYSYKVVVKQTEQEYYNVYLPGILNGYPDYDGNASDVPDPEDSIAHITLIGDNINKVPRNLTEVGPEQKQYGSEVQLYGRVTPERSDVPTATTPYYPETNAQTVVTISEQDNLFTDSNTNPPYSTIYQSDSNPYVARLAQNNVGNPPAPLPLPIGSLQQNNISSPYQILLGVFETAPVESLLDIFWETSSSGLISDLNSIAGQDTTVSGFANFESNWYENSTPGSNLTENKFIPTFEGLTAPEKLTTSEVRLISITRGASNQDIKEDLFEPIEKSNEGGFDCYNLKVKETQLFSSTLENNKYNFTFEVSGTTNAGATSGLTNTTVSIYLKNVQPSVTNAVNVSVGDRINLLNPIATFEGLNGCSLASENTEDLVWSVSSSLNSLEIDQNGNLYEKTGNASGGYSFSLTIKDAGGSEASGTPSSLSKTYDLDIIFGEDQINEEFGAKTNFAISRGLTSSGMYWGNFDNSSLIESTAPGLLTSGAGDPNTKAAQNGMELDTSYFINNPQSIKNSASGTNNNVKDVDSNDNYAAPYSWGNEDHKPSDATNSSLQKGTAYVTVSFEYDNFRWQNLENFNYPDNGQFAIRNEQYGVNWLAYFQYRPNSNVDWQTAVDIEGQDMTFGGEQVNQVYPTGSSDGYNQFVSQGFLNSYVAGQASSSAAQRTNVASASSFSISTNTTRPPYSAPKSVFTKTFAFGKDQSYELQDDKFGEYRIILKYPQPRQGSSTANPFSAVVPTYNSAYRNAMAPWAWINGSGAIDRALEVNISYGDFYYPEESTETAYKYLISEGGNDTETEAANSIANKVVWAREWHAKYVTQFYTESDLRNKITLNSIDKYHSYRPDNSKNATDGAAIRGIGSDMTTPTSISSNNYSNSSRSWVAVFSEEGLKKKGSAVPCTSNTNGATN